MKGDLEFSQILGIIILVILLAVIFIVVIIPVIGSGNATGTQLSFREACLFWSQNSYRGTTYTDNNGVVRDMSTLCAQTLGRFSMPSDPSDPAWESCRNACRGS